MRRKLCFGILFLGPWFSIAETVKDREGAVRDDAATMEENDRWIYNDIDAGFAEANRTRKPLMVVLRCVPCLACMGLDAEVLMENEELTPLMDQFVRVRVINANALDLSLFQFDYDLSFSVMFFSPDKKIYGRFGSWEHQKDSQNKATSGLRQAMERVLAIHGDKSRFSEALRGKRGTPMRWATPVDMPLLEDRYTDKLDWEGPVVKSCVHCHQIGDAIREEIRDRSGTLPLRWIYPYPTPETIGLVLTDEPVTEVDKVLPGSPAEDAGFQPGDDIVSLEERAVMKVVDKPGSIPGNDDSAPAGQPLISVADISWVLHHAPDTGQLRALVDRNGEQVSLDLKLPMGWRHATDISRRVGTWPMRRMAFGGMKLQALSNDEKAKHGIEEGKLALHAEHVGQYGAHAAAKKKGFKKGDIIVEIDGSDGPLTESRLIARHLTEHKPGDKIPATVLRNGKRLELEIPVQ